MSSSLDSDLVSYLSVPGEDVFHNQVKSYLEREGCNSKELFRHWVDSSQEWTELLKGDGFDQISRKHIAHVKARWERLSTPSADSHSQDTDSSHKKKKAKHAKSSIRAIPSNADGPSPPGLRAVASDGPDLTRVAENGANVAVEAAFWKKLVTLREHDTIKASLETLTVANLCSLTGESLRVEHILNRFDQDMDGLINTQELSNALISLGFPITRERAVKIIQHILQPWNDVSVSDVPSGEPAKPEIAAPEAGPTGDQPPKADAAAAAAEAVASETSPAIPAERSQSSKEDDLFIDAKVFERMLKCLRLAELFTPSAGIFQWTDSIRKQDDMQIWVCDYSAETCVVSMPLQNHNGEPFFFGSRSHSKSSPNRWVHFDATQGMDRLNLLRLAVKYNLHPLAVDDVLDNRTPTKIDRYGRNYVVSCEILALSTESRRLPGEEPKRVKIHRSHATFFLPRECNTLVSIHQERDDNSSWLQMWQHAAMMEAESDCIFVKLLEDLQTGSSTFMSSSHEDLPRETPSKQTAMSAGGVRADFRPIQRMREEAADFLLYEALHRVVLQFRPIAEAYAERLGSMHQMPIYKLSKVKMDEIAEIKLEVYDFVRSIRPMRLVVKHLIEDKAICETVSMYLEDVDDAIESVMLDMEHLTKMAETLEDAHERNRDKSMNDTLFALSILSAIFLPLQFATGWYGMNFINMPELEWDFGYQYFLILQLFFLVVSTLGILFARFGFNTCWRTTVDYLCCLSRNNGRINGRGNHNNNNNHRVHVEGTQPEPPRKTAAPMVKTKF